MFVLLLQGNSDNLRVLSLPFVLRFIFSFTKSESFTTALVILIVVLMILAQ